MPQSAIKISDLQLQFQEVVNTSPIGFESAINLLNQNADDLIEDWEVFNIFGSEHDCRDFVNQLGFSDFSELRPSTTYYGTCPVAQDSQPIELNSCSTSKILRDDAQVGLNFLISLGIYLTTNREIIQLEESAGLFTECSVESHHSTAPVIVLSNTLAKVEPQNISSEIPSMTFDWSNAKPIANPDSPSSTDNAILFNAADRELIESIGSDPKLLDYLKNVCNRARTHVSDNVTAEELESAAAAVLEYDSAAGNNQIQDYLTEDNDQFKMNCALPE